MSEARSAGQARASVPVPTMAPVGCGEPVAGSSLIATIVVDGGSARRPRPRSRCRARPARRAGARRATTAGRPGRASGASPARTPRTSRCRRPRPGRSACRPRPGSCRPAGPRPPPRCRRRRRGRRSRGEQQRHDDGGGRGEGGDDVPRPAGLEVQRRLVAGRRDAVAGPRDGHRARGLPGAGRDLVPEPRGRLLVLDRERQGRLVDRQLGLACGARGDVLTAARSSPSSPLMA